MANSPIKPVPRYSDFTNNLLVHPVSSDLARLTEIDAVKRSIRNLVLTDRYERLLNPRIGSNIRRVLFEPMDSTSAFELKSFISEVIRNFEKRANLVNVVVTPDYDNHTYLVTIVFSVTFSEEEQTVQFFLNRIR